MEAILNWITEKERESVRQAIRDYATKAAGTPDDLDVELENASVEAIAEISRNPK